MLTRLSIRNFKRFEEADIELGSPVVFIGPNNSGKTSALQALSLWEVGLRRWNERRAGRKTPEKRPGVTLNRKDLLAVPVPGANLLWRDLHTRDVQKQNGKQQTRNVLIEVLLEGVTDDRSWSCGLEFDYANEESLYCRPLRLAPGKNPSRMVIPEEAGEVTMAFLPPMSGLSATETRLDPGAVSVRIGEGRTAEVLRNLCYEVHSDEKKGWDLLCRTVKRLFGAELLVPSYIPERGEIVMKYRENRMVLDLSCAGRGLQQTLLLLAYIHANPGSVLLLDEPDAHLEVLRQRQIYQVLSESADAMGSQIIAASHSEVLLNEAADRDMVVAFVGQPHRIDDQGSQVRKALREIGFEHYYLAKTMGWVLYLEGSTDLAILRALAARLGHTGALEALEKPFVKYVGNQPMEACKHYYGLREAVPALKAIALFDRLDKGVPEHLNFPVHTWQRREIESYVCTPTTLEAYARTSGSHQPGTLFERRESEIRVKAMRDAIASITESLENLGYPSPWGGDLKVSDEFLVPLFKKFYALLNATDLTGKKAFYELAQYVPADEIDPEVTKKLDAIAAVAGEASPGDNS